ncbi:MAG: membrane protein insertion efficiency factor YidD [Nitrospirota bacterium]
MRNSLLLLIRIYQKYISVILPSTCRFYPRCSQYAYEAIVRYGVRKGIWLATLRLLKCHPFHPGGYNPV